jgi:hypothetical protein
MVTNTWQYENRVASSDILLVHKWVCACMVTNMWQYENRAASSDILLVHKWVCACMVTNTWQYENRVASSDILLVHKWVRAYALQMHPPTLTYNVSHAFFYSIKGSEIKGTMQYLHAVWRGYRPLVECMSTSDGKFCSISFTVSQLPVLQAMWRAVQPSLFTICGSASWLSKMCTVWSAMEPNLVLASIRGVQSLLFIWFTSAPKMKMWNTIMSKSCARFRTYVYVMC